jgi:hypothetical protein
MSGECSQGGCAGKRDARDLIPVSVPLRQIARVIVVPNTLPPYGLAAPSFRFRALASLAARASLGGPREVVLATYLCARLAHDCHPTRLLPSGVRSARAVAARAWLSSMSLPAVVRAALTRLADATEEDVPRVAPSLQAVIAATDTYLDAGARSELERLAAALGA